MMNMNDHQEKTSCKYPKERPFLVGHSGKIKYDGRLLALRGTKKYRRWLEEEKSVRHEKMCQISELSEKYKNMSQLIHSLRKENRNNVNQSLVKELSNEMENVRRYLLHLKSNLNMSDDNVNGLFQNYNPEFILPKIIKNRSSIKRKRSSTGTKVHNKYAKMINDKKKVSLNNCQAKVQKTTRRTELFANSLPGCFESEINVKDRNSVIRTIKIDLFSSGENLLAILESQFGLQRSSYRVRFKKRQLDRDLSLFDQGIFHGTTVRLSDEFKKRSNIGPSAALIEQKNLLSERYKTEEISGDEVIDDNDRHCIQDKNISRSVKTQIFVRDSVSSFRPINIDLSASGADLMLALCAEFGAKISSCEIFCGSTKLNLATSLLDQGITHGSTIDFDARLHGGMESEDTSRKNVVGNRSETSDFEKTLHLLSGDRHYLQASQKVFRKSILHEGENYGFNGSAKKVNFPQLLQIAERALEKGELEIAEKSLTQAIKTEKLTSNERNVKPYLYLAEIYERKADDKNVELLLRQRFLLQAAALYNFVLNFVKAVTLQEKQSIKITKSVSSKLHDIQDSLVSTTGRNPPHCSFDSESKRKELDQLRSKINDQLQNINCQQSQNKKASISELDYREIFVQQTAQIKDVYEAISLGIKEFLAGIINECMKVLGEPPCDYEVIVLGSLARNEMTPYSDLEWAILTSSDEEKCKVFFRNLTNLVHLQIINLGETILPSMDIKALESDWFFDDITPRGLSFDAFLPQACKTPLGNIKDFELIHTPKRMAEFQSNSWYENNPGLAEILLTVSPLEPGRHVLTDQYKQELADILRIPCDLHKHDIGDDENLTRGACRGHEILKKDLSRYGQAVMTGDDEFDEGKLYDVKKEIYRLTDRVVSGLGKCFDAQANGAFEVIDVLHKRGVISSSARDNLASASAIGLKLRISTYLKAGKQGEELKAKSTDTSDETTSSYYMPQDEELFHFFYVAIPLYEELQHFFLEEKQFTKLPQEAFFNYDDAIKSSIYCRILNYTKAVECYKRALTTDPDNVNMEIRQLRLLLVMNEDTKSIKHKLDCVLGKILGVSYNTLMEDTPNDEQLDAILTSVRPTVLRQLLEIIMLLSTLQQMDWHLKLALMIFNHLTAMEDTNKFMESQLHMMDLAFPKLYLHIFPNWHGFDSLITELSSLIDSEGVTTTSITCLNKMAELFLAQGTYGKSYNCLERAVTMERTLYGTNLNLNIMKTLHLLGEVSAGLSMFAEAEFYRKQMLQQFESFSGPRQRLMHKQACLELAGFCSETNRVEEAISYLQKGLQLSTDRNLFLERNFDCMMQCEKAKLWHRLSENNEVRISLLNAKEYLSGNVAAGFRVAMTCYVAMTFHDLGESDEAEMLLKEEIQRLKLHSNQEELAFCLIKLGKICNQKGRRKEAETYYNEALEIIMSCPNNNTQTDDLIECLLELSDILAGNGKPLEARRKLEDAKKYVSTIRDKHKKCNMLKELGERWELFDEMYLATSCYEEAISLSGERTLGKNIPNTEFFLELKLGDLAGKANFGRRAEHYESYVTKEQRTEAQRRHYDRARSLLQQYTRGNFDIMSIKRFVLLATKYAYIDAKEMENLLLNALEISNVIFGSANGNDTTSLILLNLFACYQVKGDFTSAAHTMERSLRIEISEHSSDCLHEHICHRLVFFSWINLMTTPTSKDTGELLVELFSRRLNDEGFTNSSATVKANAAHCFTFLSLIFWCYKDFEQSELFNKIGLELFEEMKEHAMPENRVCSKNICYKMKKILEDPTNRIDTLELFQFLTLQMLHENDMWGFLNESNIWEREKALSRFRCYFNAKHVDMSSFIPKFISLLYQYSNDPEVESKAFLSYSGELLKQFLRQVYDENLVTHVQTLSLDESMKLLLSAKNIVCSAFSIKGGMSFLNTDARNLVCSVFVKAVQEPIPSTHHGLVTDHIVEDHVTSSLNEPSSLTANTQNDTSSSVPSSLFWAIHRSQVTNESDTVPPSNHKDITVDTVAEDKEKNSVEHVEIVNESDTRLSTVNDTAFSDFHIDSEREQNHINSDSVHPILVVLEFSIQNLVLQLLEKNADVTRINEGKGEKSSSADQAIKDIKPSFSLTPRSEELPRDLSQPETVHTLSEQQPQTSQSMHFEIGHSLPQLGDLETREPTRPMIPVIQKLSDSAANFLEKGEVQKFLESRENLSSLFKSYVELAPKNMVETFLGIAAERLKTHKTNLVRGSLAAAAQFPRSDRQDAKLSKLGGDCWLLEGCYRLAAIGFTRAVEYYSSNSTQDSCDVLEYLETLNGLIKAHILCQKVNDAWQVCQRGMSLLPQLELSSVNICHRTMEFYYLSAKCLLSLSNSKVTNDELEKAVSFCRQGLDASKIVNEKINTKDLEESLGKNGEFFAMKCEIQLLLATIQLQLNKQEEAEEILADMKNVLGNVAVRFETFTAATWEGGELEFFKASSRLFSWIGRAFVMNGEAESAIKLLAKSLSAFVSTNQMDTLSLHKELIPLLDSIAITKQTVFTDRCDPFQQTIDMYKGDLLEKHDDVNMLYESFSAAGFAYMEMQRTNEAISLYEAALTAAECMSISLGAQQKQGTIRLRLGHAHRLRAVNNIGEDGNKERSLARKYYNSDTDLHKYSLLKKVSLAYWLLEENEFAEANVSLQELLKLEDKLPDVFVTLGYCSRHFYGPVMKNYIEEHGECTITIVGLVYSLAVFVYVEMGMTKEAISACDKLSTQRDFGGTLSTRPLVTTYLTVACQRKLSSLVNDRYLQTCDFPLSPTNLARLYYELKEYEHILKYSEEIVKSAVESPLREKESTISRLLIVGNIFVEGGGHDACYSLFTLLLKVLNYEEEILDKEFDKQSALLDECSLADHFYLLRLLATVCARRGNFNAAMKCYEKCLDGNENLESRQELVVTLADLYQSKAMQAKDDKTTYTYWMNLARDLYARLLRNVARITPFVESSYAAFLCKIDCHREAIDHLQNVIHESTEDTNIDFGHEDKPLLDPCLSREIEVRGSLSLPLKVVAYYQLSSAYMKVNEIKMAQESALALENYAASLQSSQDPPLIQSVVGYAYKLIGNKQKAFSVFVSVLEKLPEHLPVVEALLSVTSF